MATGSRIAKSPFPNYYHAQDMRSLPKLPDKPSINLSRRSPSVTKWIKAPKHKGCEATLTRLVERIQYIEFGPFNEGLKRSYRSIAGNVEPSLRTAIGIVPGKSNEWVTKIAMTHFKNLAQFPCFNIAHNGNQTLLQAMQRSIEIKQLNDLPQQIILFDDGSYSGEQMVNHVQSLVDIMRYKAPDAKIIVVVPYMTSRALERLSAIDTGRIRLMIAESHRIPTLKESLANADYQNLKKVFPELTEADSGVTLTFFQHKIPNSQSFFSPVAELIEEIATPYKPEEGKGVEDGG